MHDIITGPGPLHNWLGIVVTLGLMYLAWRIVAAFQHRSRRNLKTPAASATPTPAPAQPAPDTGPPPEDIVVIAAAVQAMLGAHRIVHIETSNAAQVWAVEGRWMHQTSHYLG
jgi:hypothetical protein